MRNTMKKTVAGIFAGIMALSLSVAVSAGDRVEYNFCPEYKVDFDRFIYNDGEDFPLETLFDENDKSYFNYSDIECSAGSAEGFLKIKNKGAVHGNALEVIMGDFSIQTATDLNGTIKGGKITVKFDMLVPEEINTETDKVIIQTIATKTDTICTLGKGSVIEYPINQWFTITKNYYISADNTTVETETLLNYNGVEEVIAERADAPRDGKGQYNQFTRTMRDGGMQKIRFVNSGSNASVYYVDNISISSLPVCNAESGEYEMGGEFTTTGSHLNYDNSVSGASYAYGIGGKNYTVAKFDVPTLNNTPNFQLRDAYHRNVLTDEYVEIDAEYYFPQKSDAANIVLYLYSQMKATNKDGVRNGYGDHIHNRNIQPWEIINGKIGVWNGYAANNIPVNDVDVPVNEWFTVRTKLYKEDGKLFFAVDLIKQTSGEVTSVIPKVEVTWNGSDVAKGIFSIRETIKAADTPIYAGTRSISKSPVLEIGELYWCDDEGIETDSAYELYAMTPSVAISNFATEPKSVVIWCAAYDDNDKLLDVKFETVTLKQGVLTNAMLSECIEVNDDAEYYRAGLMDNEGNIKPLTASKDIFKY